ncbi:MAG: helix-turn-helix domain-containing protein [Armatimonadota bacterium]
MRSLEEWTKYLEQQEQALQQKLTSEDAPKPETQHHGQAATVKKDTSESSPRSSTNTVQFETKIAKTERSKPTKAQLSTPSAGENGGDGDLVKEARALRQRVSEALQIHVEKSETAQASYRTFKESREELLRRLLDPVLSLEDTARILNVCPTTVRRYTNRGLLKHFRTGGNQRRFRLSDVLAFLESRSS